MLKMLQKVPLNKHDQEVKSELYNNKKKKKETLISG